MRIDVTLLGISGNSLRWLRRLAPWSIVPLVLGALVLATVALGSVRYNGPAYGGAANYHANMYGSARTHTIVEEPGIPQTYKVKLGDNINVLPNQGWSSITLSGMAIEQVGPKYVAVHPGRAVLESHRGTDIWKYTIVVARPTVR